MPDSIFKTSKPVQLNCYKHHKNFIVSQIHKISNQKSFDKLLNDLKVIGSSQLDVYTGELSPKKISIEIIDLLKKQDIYAFDNYRDWLDKENKGYFNTTIQDKSIWTLRLGNDKNYYVHIHPARNSLLSSRFKAHTLKIAISLLAYKKMREIGNILTIDLINMVRVHYLNLSPVIKTHNNSALKRCISMLYYEDIL